MSEFHIGGGLYMESYIKKLGTNSMLISALLIIFSVFLIFNPVETLNFLIIAFGVILVINGLMHIISYFSIKNDFRAFSFELVQGIVSIIIGFVFIMRTQEASMLLPLILGAWIIIESIMKFQLAFNLRDVPNSHWVMMLVFSIITAALGIVILLNPFSTTIAITTLGGVLLLLTEVINLFESGYILMKVVK